MKKILIVNTRWEYYASNIIGMIVVIGLITWLIHLSFGSDGLDFQSIFFWLAVLLAILIPFALISFLSSMKSVEVTQKGLVISYIFTKHKNHINFSGVKEFKSKVQGKGTAIQPQSVRDTFMLVLDDGRVFEFSRSQFDQYNKLKSICSKAVSQL